MKSSSHEGLIGFQQHEDQISALKALTKKHRETPETGKANSFLIKKEHLQQLMNQDGAEGIRIHIGFDGENLHPILTATDQTGDTMQTFALASMSPCPPECPPQKEF